MLLKREEISSGYLLALLPYDTRRRLGLSPLYCNPEFRNINLIPFRTLDGVTLVLRTD